MNSRDSGTENELSLVGEYIKLFAVDPHQRQSDKPQKVVEDAEEEIPINRDYWVHDKWNDEELNRAQKTLEDNLEKCWISALDRNKSGRIDNDDDGSAWDRFYSNHGTRFFKDRHYLERAFPEDFYEGNDAPAEGKRMTLVEIGCGVGNAILPMMDDDRQLEKNIVNDKKKIRWDVIHGLDISQEAIALMKKDPRFVKAHSIQRAFGHVCDITEAVPQPCIGSADVTTLLFCLSAIDPDDDMPAAARNVASILKPGGTLLFRDYGRYDEAQMKLGVSRSKCLKENFYRKHDGTKCFYFTLEDLEKLFTDAGLRVLELEYLQRVYGNLKSGEKRRRVWVHARCVKP